MRRRHTKPRLLVTATALGCLHLLMYGCGGPGTADVTGTVKFDGKPLPAGMIAFTSEDGRGATSGIADGTYLATGVPTGAVKVTVTTPEAAKTPRPKGGAVDLSKKFGPPKGVELPPEAKGAKFNPYGESENVVSIPKKYGDPAQSGLTLTVTSGKNTFDVDLKK